MRDGKLVFMLQRRDIETRDAPRIAAQLTAAFDEHCGDSSACAQRAEGPSSDGLAWPASLAEPSTRRAYASRDAGRGAG